MSYSSLLLRSSLENVSHFWRTKRGLIYSKIWIPKWCKYNCDSWCVYHCGILWWFRMWSIPCSVFYDHWLSNQHCKGLTNHQAVKGAVYKPILYGLMVICKYHNALVLYIPLKILYFSLKSAVCRPQSQNVVGSWLKTFCLLRSTMAWHTRINNPPHLTNCSENICDTSYRYGAFRLLAMGPNLTIPALRPLCLQDQNH